MKRVAIVGATGAVGQEFRAVLAQRRFPAASYRLLASASSAGKTIDWIDGPAAVQQLTPSAFDGIDFAFFCAGSAGSREFVPHARRAGAIMTDHADAQGYARDGKADPVAAGIFLGRGVSSGIAGRFGSGFGADLVGDRFGWIESVTHAVERLHHVFE